MIASPRRRHAGYVVVLDEDLCEDAARRIANTISGLKGVTAVISHYDDASIAIAEQRLLTRMSRKLLAANSRLVRYDEDAEP